MKKKSAVILIISVFIILLGWEHSESGKQKKNNKIKKTVLELDWNDLVPQEFNPHAVLEKNGITFDEINRLNDNAELAKKIMSDLKAEYKRVGVVEELNGKRISLIGFAVPLEYSSNGKLVKEFLLVPYKGACIHLPPPPPQQIIYVKSRTGIGTPHIYRMLIVKGVLRTESARSKYATASYTLESFYITIAK